MRYCARCVYPENAKPTIIFDEEGVCSGCRYHESRARIDWKGREKVLAEILAEYKAKAEEAGSIYHCIIPVSGGKDSHFQVHLIKNVYGLNPLLVTYNHAFNTREGIRNLNNMVAQFGCDLIRITSSPHSARKIARHMLRKVGDITWHYHAGIRTVPFQVATRYKIPLVVWGEQGFAELTGMFQLEDMVEFTKWCRQEHDMRGHEPQDLISEESGITWHDLAPFKFPTDEEIESVGVKGIYLSNFVYWNAHEHARFVMEKYNFDPFRSKRERTFLLYGKIEDHANDVHDYLKYLKFGYGRATDDSSMEIRHGRMSREQAIELVRQYDSARPPSLDVYLKFLEITEQEFIDAVEPMRDTSVWKKEPSGQWVTTDSVANHVDDPGVDAARRELVPEEDRTFGERNRHMFYSPQYTPPVSADERYLSRGEGAEFVVL